MIGPGKYDQVCTDVRKHLRAAGVILVVCNGHQGSGFSAQLPIHLMRTMPKLLRDLAAQIEAESLTLPTSTTH